ncbi:MAG TPA: hypothetical protein VF790_00690 [Dissulfurispiraceae bacterium]
MKLTIVKPGILFFLPALLLAVFVPFSFAGGTRDEQTQIQARDIGEAYPEAKAELAEALGWQVDFQPEIRLVRGRDALRKMIGSDIVVAFAVPEDDLIVIDTSRAYSSPFNLKATLKHELCHLILHRHIKNAELPRWLDEGVCQWASGGIDELMAEGGSSALAKASISGTLIPFWELGTFPRDEQSMVLAYEQSRSMVDFIVHEYGAQGLRKVLASMESGHPVDASFERILSLTSQELEAKWREHLRREYTWVSYLSSNLVTLLFVLAALATVCGFVRMLRKKKAYADMDEEDNEEPPYHQ